MIIGHKNNGTRYIHDGTDPTHMPLLTLRELTSPGRRLNSRWSVAIVPFPTVVYKRAPLVMSVESCCSSSVFSAPRNGNNDLGPRVEGRAAEEVPATECAKRYNWDAEQQQAHPKDEYTADRAESGSCRSPARTCRWRSARTPMSSRPRRGAEGRPAARSFVPIAAACAGRSTRTHTRWWRSRRWWPAPATPPCPPTSSG